MTPRHAATGPAAARARSRGGGRGGRPPGRGGSTSERAAAGGRAAVDAYLAGLDPVQRAALERLRRLVRAAAPGAEEGMGYGVPSFRVGTFLVGYAAAKGHLSFFPGSTGVAALGAEALPGFSTSRGTVRFQPDRPIPAAVVRRMVRARLAEVEARRPRRGPRRTRRAR